MRVSAFLFAIFAFTNSVRAEDWTEFRGPTGQGLYTGKNLPIEWSTTKNVAWKTSIPGRGWSSPILLKGRVYLTSAVPIKGSKDLSLKAICLDAGKGTILWQTEVFVQDGARAPRIHGKNSHASPTPITDGKRLYVHFGHQGSAALDLNGKVLWRNRELRYAPVHGNGGTPILAGDRLIFSADGADKQFVVALDTASGKVAWNTDRKSQSPRRFSFSTPLLISVNGKEQIISPASDKVGAYDAKTGNEIWQVKYDGYSVIPRPVFGHGLIFISTGYNSPSVLAIRPDGAGDVTQTHVAWTLKKGAPHTPSLLLAGDELYMVSDSGIASCVDAKTGNVHWQERIGGGFSASPFFADGKVYLQSETGVTTVLRAGKTFEVLATSKLGERTFACYAVADGAIYLRTESKLYRIQRQP
ncbi:MAG: PQQ-like beta-propeller repeat protein [Planctomycetes bacterium]|jgi:outer membrane protein assembly factor BamB|nr:PQQ-like beta-propeller repeat protein [Planctomycetota bacterium]